MARARAITGAPSLASRMPWREAVFHEIVAFGCATELQLIKRPKLRLIKVARCFMRKRRVPGIHSSLRNSVRDSVERAQFVFRRACGPDLLHLRNSPSVDRFDRFVIEHGASDKRLFRASWM